MQLTYGAGVAAVGHTLCLVAAAVAPAGSAHGMMYSPATCSVYIKNLPEQVGGLVNCSAHTQLSSAGNNAVLGP
jgi:hypothetical protein